MLRRLLRGFRQVDEEVPDFSTLSLQRRFSFKYATKLQHDEMRQPFYIHEKRHGIFSNEQNIKKSRRGLPFITPLYTKHMNLWETDTDATNNRFFRGYVFGQRELHQLLGRPHGFEAANSDGSQGSSAYELQTDQRYKGVPRPVITNLHYEPEWCYTLYRAGSHGSQLANPRSPLTEEVLGSELIKIRDIKSMEHCKAWYERLQYLIQLHYNAVGDIGEFKSRHTQHVHEFFIAFHDALSSFDFQDAYLVEHLRATRPAELEDLFGIFLEMEANYVNEDYCPRCSLPYSTTRYCGEGDTTTPFRRHRGRWAPHQRWGREWFDVVARRAEALWNRATEDPYFGFPEHTQRQAEALLKVYVQTKQRGKAVDFMNALRGSKEFLMGIITVTDAMQKAYDHLLDTTPHPHLLTNSFTLENIASKYTGEAHKAPFSPLQFRIDMEMSKYRRMQKEEGVVRVPPAQWRLDTSSIVPYKIDGNTKRIVNWREVKEGIEKSFLSTGLPREAYGGEEWREMLHLHAVIAERAKKAEEVAQQLDADRPKCATGKAIVFPDREGYRVFDTTPESLRPFGISQSGTVLQLVSHTFPSPEAVPYNCSGEGSQAQQQLLLDTTAEMCRVFGGFEHGDQLAIRAGGTGDDSKVANGLETRVIVVGVSKEGTDAEWQLLAMHADPAKHKAEGLVALGTDCIDIRTRWASIRYTAPAHQKASVSILDAQRTAREESLAQVVGVRDGVLFVQWRLLPGGGSTMDRSVAVPIGNAEQFRAMYTMKEQCVESLEEPPSWRTPFRNDFAEERLKELQQAPFTRERWASLIKGKYTPKVKRFGYAQHRTVDDFETKEYKDRLLSKQFFHNPQAFEVIPDRRDRSVSFGGKWEYQRTQGLPTVDRNELENGWSEVEPISDSKMHVVEQALRDISGRRPGNFIKSPTETNSLRLNESWWAPLEFGWEQHNKEQQTLVDPTEQRLIAGASLPFGGKAPPFGTTYGMGERVREIADDFAKGFGLGPHGHSPSHDTSHHNTLGSEEDRVRDLGYSSAIVRLFDEKLGDKDIHQWALEQCPNGEADVRRLLLSLNEWREKGRPPSLLLAQILSRYLADEITAFNEGAPPGAPRLSLQTTDGTLSAGRGGTPWADVNPMAYALQYAAQHVHSRGDEPFVLQLLKRARLERQGAVFPDQNYTAYLSNSVVAEFQMELARLVGRGISSSFLAQKTGQLHRGSARWSGHVIPFVKSRELAQLLARMGVSTESIAVVLRGLANCPEQESLGDDFAVPVSLILSWGGPGTESSAASSSPSSRNEQNRRGSAMLSNTIRQLGHQRGGGEQSQSQQQQQQQRQNEDKMVVHVLEELSLRDDGVVMDIQYAVRENKRNPVLRQEFFAALLPVFANNDAKVAALYDDYCEGKYVPNITVAIEAFVAFLHNVTAQPDTYAGEAYFDPNESGQYAVLRLIDPANGPFVFDNVMSERITTVERFRRYGILAGPVRAPTTGFIAANSKSLNYFTRRQEEVVYVSTDNDQGLRRTLERSAYYKTIAANPALQFLLNARDGAGLVATFNRYFYRTMPMLSFYQQVLRDYSATVQTLRHEAQESARNLVRILDSERSAAIEEFRRNSERYWRNIIEGRSVEQAMANGGSSSSHSASGPAAAQGGRDMTKAYGEKSDNRRQQQQQQQQQHQQQNQQQQQRRGDGVRTTFPSRPGGGGSGGSRQMADLLSKLNTPKGSAKGPQRRGGGKGGESSANPGDKKKKKD